MIYKAILKNSLTSDLKARFVVRDLKIIGKSALQAIEILKHTPKKAAKLILGVLISAVSNAENNAGESVYDLYVESVTIDQGMSLKRYHPRAKGRSAPIKKRRSHITVEIISMKKLMQSLQFEFDKVESTTEDAIEHKEQV